MKQFIKKIVIIILLVFTLFSFFLISYGGFIDSFYVKFTTPKASSMIIGDSRGLTGIRPDIINEELKNEGYELPITNYCFTIAQAPIGPLYRESILKKLKTNTKNGLFIISISPLMLLSENDHNNYKGEFVEAGLSPHNMQIVDMNPNYEYLIKNYSSFHFKAFLRKNLILQKNGWLQDNNLPSTEADYKKRRDWWINSYNNFEKKYSISKYRLASFDTLIKTLKQYGEVHLARLPVDSIFLPLEESMYPNFDKLIDSLSSKNNINYFNYKHESEIYKTLDGMHISKIYSDKFTKSLCDSIVHN
ncbi:hypothetical protein L3X39_09045 [Sabulilitoribacter multivorans]|uniref:DltD C-terminal region n=1 Tax=Flaviramulus multivorans TaxID=1304750 RepID=A0ABS9IJL0_9FLAO|nr:hypothetical protein [Flaviramulus multivorans]MCF7560783.1 hypothetical protein [Flaviramulus multivorans]